MNSRRNFFGKLAITVGAAAAAVIPSKLIAEEKKEEIPLPGIKDEPKYALSDLDCPAGSICVNGMCESAYHIPEKAVNSFESVHPDLKVKLTNPHSKYISGAAMITPDGQSVYIGTLQPGETVTLIGVPGNEKTKWYLKREGEALKLLNGEKFNNEIVYSTRNPSPPDNNKYFEVKNTLGNFGGNYSMSFPTLDE